MQYIMKRLNHSENCDFFEKNKKFLKKVLTYTYVYSIIYIESEVREYENHKNSA